jgi:cell wall-associated NlpC family hydrolase
LLVLVLTWCAVLGPARAHAAEAPRHLEPWYADRLGDARLLGARVVATPRKPSLGARAARYAHRLLGVPYRWGSDSPSVGFDCSGLVRHVFGRFGLELPHSSYADFELGKGVARSSLRPGDLVFFDGLGHDGIYIGDGLFIHSPHTGDVVKISSLHDSWYASTFVGARRIL